MLSALKDTLPVYKKLGASGLIALVGEHIEGMSAQEQIQNITDCLNYVKPFLEENGINLFVEPLNDKDRKNYFMPNCKPLFTILREINSKNIRMLYDIYHQHMMEDFSLDEVKENIDLIGHFHIADCPGRHEPGTAEVDYIDIISTINTLNYDGYIGLEYRATKPDNETLGFLKEIKNV